MKIQKQDITDTITCFTPDATRRFTACSGIIVRSAKTVWIDMNLGEKNVKALMREFLPGVAAATHYHLDHSVWLQFMGAKTQIRIPGREKEYFTSLDHVIDQTARPFGLADEWKKFMVGFLGYKETQNFQTLGNHNEAAEFLPEAVLLETPGHSPGHTSFYFPEDKILFSGDLGLDRFGPWYGWKECSIPDFVKTLLKLSHMDIRLILTSHGGMISSGIKKAWAGSLARILSREQKITKLLDAGLAEEDIIKQGVFYTGKQKVEQPMRSFLTMWDTAMFQHHRAVLDQGGIKAMFPELKKIR